MRTPHNVLHHDAPQHATVTAAAFLYNMAYEYTLGLPFLAGVLVLTPLFIAWYRGVDPLVCPITFF